MSILTPFGTLDFDDEDTLKDWSATHAIRHMTLDREMARQHRAISTVTLFGELNRDWFGRHWLKHQSLNQAVTNKAATGATATSSFEHRWRDANEFYTWHRAHTRAHENLERALGIVSGAFIFGGALLLESSGYVVQENSGKLLL
jgi:hypothetical protein